MQSFALSGLMLVCLAAGAAPDRVEFSLPDAHGVTHTAGELGRHKATVLLFVATECPNSNTYAPVLARMYREYSSRGVLFLAVYSDPDDSSPRILRHDDEYQIPYAALIDPRQTLARQTGARSTPEAVIVSSHGQVLYRGRVDDRFVDFGKTRFQPAEKDLQQALDQVLAGQAVTNPVTKVLGCAIPGVD
jgi:hypothetical protein